MTVLVLTYHGIGRDGGVLAVEPELFAEQLDALVDAGAAFLTVSQVTASVRAGDVPSRG